MAAKLQLVRDYRPDRDETGREQEDRYRHPAHEEMWEVSCDHEGQDHEKPKATGQRRHAS